jgi:hypothetical protein
MHYADKFVNFSFRLFWRISDWIYVCKITTGWSTMQMFKVRKKFNINHNIKVLQFQGKLLANELMQMHHTYI